MPAKGSKAKNTPPQEQETPDQEFHSFDQVAAKLTADFDTKFAKLHKAIEAMSAPAPALASSDAEPPAKKRKTPAEIEPHQTRSKGPANVTSSSPQPRPVKITAKKPSATVSKPPDADRNAMDEPSSQQPLRQPASAILVPPQNVNNNIPGWITDEIQYIQPSAHSLPLSNRDIRGNDTLDNQVQQILATTAHQLTKGTRVDKSFPCKYIIKGPERKPANVNTVSLQEHLWGISRMIRDPVVPQDIKPLLYVHLEEILEDSREYDWPSAVRAWSEECFSQVEEKRLSWHDSGKIQLLRTSLSRTSTAKVNQGRDLARPPRQQQFHSNYSNYDAYKGGPPCPDFNSQQGCNFQSGHIVSGRKMMHICSYCLAQSSALNPHPEPYCRNKQRHANYHF